MHTISLVSLHQAILKKIDSEKHHVLLNPLPEPVIQRGESCKLYAMFSVMQWLHKTDDANPQPPAARKGDGGQYAFAPSLRHQAKQKYDSQVGEMYDGRALVALAQDNGYDQTELFDAADKAHYIETLLDALNHGYAPVVYFDVNFDTKGPGVYAGKREHAAVIAGYFYTSDSQLHFLATCWGGYYLYSADDLFQSAANLSLTRQPETFFKDTEWYSMDGRHASHSDKKKQLVRYGKQPVSDEATLRCKILLVKSSQGMPNRNAFTERLNTADLKDEAMDTLFDLQVPDIVMSEQYMPLLTEFEQLEQDIIQAGLARQLPAQLSLLEIPLLRKQLNLKKYLPLAQVIAFFSANNLLPAKEQYSTKQLQTFVADYSFNDDMIQLMQERHQVQVDDAIEGDIFHQSAKRNRSIIEEVSNSLDAQPAAIRCHIVDGYYRVEEVDGMGMTAEILCKAYLLPKISTKQTGAAGQIGRFGVGSFTKLAHLSCPQARVVVETKHKDETGYRLEFKVHQGELSISMCADASITTCGTTTEVWSDEIVADEYQCALSDAIEPGSTPISINGEPFHGKMAAKGVRICIEGVTIQESLCSPDSHTQSLCWALPRMTTIMEGRDKIIIDQDATRRIIKEKINAIAAMTAPEWVVYANTITPMIIELQRHNVSLAATDNLVDHLLTVVQQKFLDKTTPLRCIPDLPGYAALQHQQYAVLHPLLLPEKWYATVAELSPDYAAEAGRTKVYLTDFIKGDEQAGIFFDKEHNCLFFDKSYYHRMKANGYLDMLPTFLVGYGEVISLTKAVEAFADEAKPVSVRFRSERLADPLHELYKQHGILFEYDGLVVDKLLAQPQAREILSQTPTLIAQYASDCTKISITVCYAEKRFYYSPDDKTLYDAYWQPLYDRQWQYLKSKLDQNYYHLKTEELAALPEQVITLDADDVLPIYHEESKQFAIANGCGKTLEVFPADVSVHVRKVCHQLFLVMITQRCAIGAKESYFYHSHQGRLCDTRKTFYKHKMIGYCPAVLVSYEGGAYSFVSDCDENMPARVTRLLPEYDHHLAIDNYVLGYTYKKYTYPSQGNFSISDADGELVLTLKDVALPEHLITFHVHEQKGKLYLSLMDGCYNSYLYVITEYAFHFYPAERAMSFPVNAIINSDSAQYHVVDLFTGKEIANCSAHALLNRWQSDMEDHALRLREQHPFKLSDNIKHIFNINGLLAWYDDRQQIIVTTDLAWIDSIDGIYCMDNGQYDVSSPRKTSTLVPSPDKAAHFLVDDTEILPTPLGEYRFKSGILYDPEGKAFNQSKAKQAKAYYNQHVVYFLLSYSEDKNNELYDHDAHLLHQSWFINAAQESVDVLSVTVYGDLSVAETHTEHAAFLNIQLLSSSTSYPKEQRQLLAESRNANHWYLKSGYPFHFNGFKIDRLCIVQPYSLNLEYQSSKSRYMLSPLSQSALLASNTLDNLALLNQQNLTMQQYSRCLCYIAWPTACLLKIIPVIDWLRFTAPAEFAPDYAAFMTTIATMSKTDQIILIKLFDKLYHLLYETSPEPLSEKIMMVVELYGVNRLEAVYEVLAKHQAQWQKRIFYFEQMRPLIDNIDESLGQILYFLLFPAQRLLSPLAQPCISPYAKQQHVTLTELMLAYQLDTSLFSLLTVNEQDFIHALKRFDSYQRLPVIRQMQHAIYHLSDPNHHLYIRELVQNAMDASAPQSEPAEMHIDLYEEQGHCVLRIEDQGVGMSLEDVFILFSQPYVSSKRRDRHAHLIGGHGVGVFTMYHDAQLIRLKTGQGNGQVHCFEFEPVYDKQTGKIIDLTIRWHHEIGHLQGTIIERVSRRKTAVLDAALLNRLVSYHTKTVDGNRIRIHLNGQMINRCYGNASSAANSVSQLACIDIPQLGSLKLYQAVENMITVEGLAVKAISSFDEHVPEAIRSLVREKGIIIHMPQALPLNRERSDFENSDRVNHMMRPYVLTAYIKAYIQLLMTDAQGLNGLPYDFFELFERYLKANDVLQLEIASDAERIRQQQSLDNYDKYANIQHLHLLLAHLPLFQLKKDEVVEKSSIIYFERYSLIELADFCRQHKVFPPLECAPRFLQMFLRKYLDNEQNILAQKRQRAEASSKIPQVSWIPNTKTLPGSWHALLEMTYAVLNWFAVRNVTVGFSTICSGDLMHAVQGQYRMNWNVYAAADGLGRNIMDDLCANKKLRTQTLEKLLHTVSHELVHACFEKKGAITHNQAFFDTQQRLLLQLAERLPVEALQNELYAIYQNYNADDHKLSINALCAKQFYQDNIIRGKLESLGIFYKPAQDNPGLRLSNEAITDSMMDY